MITETYHRPEKSFFHEPPELQRQVDTGKLVQKLLEKEADIDKY